MRGGAGVAGEAGAPAGAPAGASVLPAGTGRSDAVEDPPTVARMRALLEELYPLPRSITGDGLRATLRALQREVPGLTLHEVPSGTRAFDWTVPPEWNVRGARLVAPDGRVVADLARHNLMLVNYSEPFRGRLPLAELRPRLHSLPDRPNAIPYRTSYYRRDWGFCLPHAELAALQGGTYEVEVDTTLAPGALTYAELVVPGRSRDEVLLSAHACHPSLANDNLSAVVVLAELARWLAGEGRRLTYRVLFAPGTIGTLVFLSRTPRARERVRHGLVLAGLGDDGPLAYKPTFRGDAAIDRAADLVLAELGPHVRLPFAPTGYDERQYASPGIRLPVGRLGRTPPGTYPEYHTSLDDLAFVKDASLAQALDALKRIVTVLEEDERLLSRAPYGEPQLGKRGLYEDTDTREQREALLWTLTMADGHSTFLDVAERSHLPTRELTEAKRRLERAGLVDRVGDDDDADQRH